MRGPPETWGQSPAHVGQEAAMKMASLLGRHIDTAQLEYARLGALGFVRAIIETFPS